MRLSRFATVYSTSLFITAILNISLVVAQRPNLPALTDSTGDGESPTTSASKEAPSKTTDKDDVTTTVATSKDAIKTSETTSERDLPDLVSTTSSSSSNGRDGLITGLPKLAGDDYPPPTVPPTANAPFMQKSTLPEGTVFICVGAFLGFVGFIVIAWRGLVAWSLHRSVRRAAMVQSSKYGREKAHAARRNSRAPFYSPDPGSTLSLDQLGASGRGGSKSNTARESLFFSPTAGGGMQAAGTRGSGYLPAGYYVAGNSVPGSGASHLGGGGSSLGNPNHRYSRARSRGPSPPLSPSLPPSRSEDVAFRPQSMAGLSMHASNSSLNLSLAPQGRAPSAYLEDLFENHPPLPESSTMRRP